MHTLISLIRRFPEQAFLLAFNAGVFTWLQIAGSTILKQFGWSANLMANSPEWLQNLAGGSVERLHSLISSGPVAWLIASLVLTLIIRFVKGLIKWTLFIFIILVGLYLIGQYQGALG